MATIVPGRDREVDLVATWFARLGSVAVMLGGGFGFKFAVDRGVIGPPARVAIGLVVGAAFVAWGEWCSTRGWPWLPQAVTAGGLVLGGLSVWAAAQLYGLIEPSIAWAALVAITVATVVQAVRHEALALGVLAAIGSFVSPAIAGASGASPESVLLYVLVTDLGLVGLAAAKRWPAISVLALSGSVVLFADVADGAAPPRALALGAAVLGVFLAAPLVRRARGGGEVSGWEVGLVPLASTAYFALGMSVLDTGYGPFAFALGASMLAVAALAHVLGDEVMPAAAGAMGLVWLVVAVPLWFEGPWIATLWAAQGAAIALMVRDRSGVATAAGGTILIGSIVMWLTELSEAGYVTERLLLTPESLVFVVQVVGLAVVGRRMVRPGRPPWEFDGAALVLATALFMGFLWVSLEAVAAVTRANVAAPHIASQFALLAAWVAYATAVLVVGVVRRERALRITGVGVFALVLAKLILHDVWTLSTSYRFVIFTALGVALLGVSAMYHRLRELVASDPVEDAVER